ncbi:MAG: CAP domain-containing protein, partial [Pseudomonadota bacterium]
DGDGFGDPAYREVTARPLSGYVDNQLDCDDTRHTVNPEANEVVDDRDNDCDGEIDEGGERYYVDADGDGYGAKADYLISLEPIAGRVNNDRDCDDNNAAIKPGAAEAFDSIDNDCDGSIDEGFTAREFYRDVDGDGIGDGEDVVVEVIAPQGYVSLAGDNCVSIPNPTQRDIDRDGIGDACDPFTDIDDDGVQDSEDNCPYDENPNQQDSDEDGKGDACDSENAFDRDNDNVNDNSDNCPDNYNPNQQDRDEDGQGDACDSVDDREQNNNAPPPVEEIDCTMTTEDRAMLNAVNAVRAQGRTCGSLGTFPAVAPLTWNCALKKAAFGHSKDMATNNFFSHTGTGNTSLGTRVTSAGYRWRAVAENIAAGLSLSAVDRVVQTWVESPGHCANLMRSSVVNFGSAKYSDNSSRYTVYWTQVFAAPL